MNYALIGSGNMAWFLADAFSRAGHTCSGLWARDARAALELATAYQLPRYQSPEEILDGMDACFLALPDDAIGEMASRLNFSVTTVFHTAGSRPLEELGTAKNKAIIWPVYSITKGALPQHRGFPVAYEGNTRKALSVAKSFSEDLSALPVETNFVERQHLHLAAVLSNNFVNHLLELSSMVCAKEKLPVSLLEPLIHQTVERLRREGRAGLRQTGPAIRRDEETIQRQLLLLSSWPKAAQAYEALTRSIQAMNPVGAASK